MKGAPGTLWDPGPLGSRGWLTGFSSFVALASGVSDGIQKLGSALSLSLSLPVVPALGPGWVSSKGGQGFSCHP